MPFADLTADWFLVVVVVIVVDVVVVVVVGLRVGLNESLPDKMYLHI